MKRFRLGTLMLLVMVAALTMTLVREEMQKRRRQAALDSYGRLINRLDGTFGVWHRANAAPVNAVGSSGNGAGVGDGH